MNQRIKIVNPKEGWRGTECYIGGQKIGNVKGIDFRVAVDEVPVFTFETLGLPDIDMSGDAYFGFTPETVQQAAVVMQNEFISNSENYKGLVASIASVLRDIPADMKLYDVAKQIADRIIGIEK